MLRTTAACFLLLTLGLFGCEGEGPRPALLSHPRPTAAKPAAPPYTEAPAAVQPTPAAGDLQPLPIVQQFTGDDSAFQIPEIFLVQSRQELAALGSLDLINHPVDFAKQSVLILALGQQPTGGYWARITAVQLQGDVLHVQGFANRPSASQATSQALTYPYAAAVIPKVQPQTLRSDIQSVSGQPAPPQ